MSSRNAYLNEEQRMAAPVVHAALMQGIRAWWGVGGVVIIEDWQHRHKIWPTPRQKPFTTIHQLFFAPPFPYATYGGQKASQNGVQIDSKSMKNDVGSHLEKMSGNVSQIFDLFFIFQEAYVLKS